MKEKKTEKGEELSDEELVEKIRSGDENAEEELITRYKDYIVKVCRHYYIVGGDMEDIVQEGMIGFYRAIKSYDPNRDAKFKTYANTCVKHQVSSAITKANSKRNQALSTAVSFQTFSESVDGLEDVLPLELVLEDTPADKAIDKETFEQLKEFLTKKLSKLELQVLKLYLQGYSYTEIADILKIKRKAIDNCLFRIKAKLKEEWNGSSAEQEAL